jgi:hypothetical protein
MPKHILTGGLALALAGVGSTVWAAEPTPFLYTASTSRAWVHYTRDGAGKAEDVAALVDECARYVEADLGLTMRQRVHVYVAGSHTELEALVGRPADFALEGLARSPEGAIIVRAGQRGTYLRSLLIHELVHVVLAQHLADVGLEPPVWLTEGLAELVADEAIPGDQSREAASRGEIIPIAALARSFPSEPVARNLAYAESRSFVQFLEREGEDLRLRRLIRAFRETGDIEAAAQPAYGRSLASFEEAWRPQFGANLALIRFVNIEGGILSVMSVLLLIGLVVRYRRRRSAQRRDQAAAGPAEREHDWQGDGDED